MDEDKPYTKKELILRSGPVELAKAVIEQWIADGKPQKDAEAIKYWQGVIDTWTKH